MPENAIDSNGEEPDHSLSASSDEAESESRASADLKDEASLAEEHLTPDRKIDLILENVTSLGELFSKRLVYDKSKEVAFDRLYNEYREIKNEQMFEYLRPTVHDLILLFDRLENRVSELEPQSTEYQFADSLRLEILEILARRDITTIDNDGSLFDPSTQKAIATNEAHDESLHNRVAKVIRRGFKFRQDRIIRPDEVIVFVYNRTEESSESLE